MKKKLIILMTLCQTAVFAQTTDNNFVPWSSTRKLTVDDFGIKISSNDAAPSFANFVVEYKVKGFDFFAKNFNDRVSNKIIVSASWIDTTANVAALIRYQQTLFDISEIYTRHFRKQLKENKKKIAGGAQFIEQLNKNIMTEFSNRRILYDKETKFGLIEEKHNEWEAQILKELYELKEFSAE